MFFNNPTAFFAQPIVATQGFTRNIVTSGLMLYLDASEAASYPGSGATWSDLSGNAYDFTLYNTWGTGGTGTNKYLSATRANTNYAQNTSGTLAALGLENAWTVQAILERTGVFNDQDFYSTNGIGNEGSTLIMSFSNQLRGHLWATGATNVLDSGTSFDGNKRAFTYQIDWSANVQRTVYNGTAQSSSTLSGTKPTSTASSETNLGTRDGGTGAMFEGYYYGILVYNRYLSTTELGQNATAFGL
jgi:hypothetical protein